MKLFFSNYCLLDEGVIQDSKSIPAGNRDSSRNGGQPKCFEITIKRQRRHFFELAVDDDSCERIYKRDFFIFVKKIEYGNCLLKLAFRDLMDLVEIS